MGSLRTVRGFSESYRDIAPPKNGLRAEGSNKTKLSRSAGKIGLNCDHCGLSFETWACWAKKHANHYCSKACTDAAKIYKVKKNCIICGKEFEVIESRVAKVVTCSRACLRANRKKLLLAEASDMKNSAIYNFGVHERGEAVSRKLTEKDVVAIFVATGSQRSIALMYGVGQSSISHIKRRHTWAHVTRSLV